VFLLLQIPTNANVTYLAVSWPVCLTYLISDEISKALYTDTELSFEILCKKIVQATWFTESIFGANQLRSGLARWFHQSRISLSNGSVHITGGYLNTESYENVEMLVCQMSWLRKFENLPTLQAYFMIQTL
jgi:hypothetical protein